MIFSLKIFFHLSTDEKIVMRNLARGRVTGRIIAHNSIPLHRNVRNAPAAVRLSRISPPVRIAHPRRNQQKRNCIAAQKPLFVRETPVRSENRPPPYAPHLRKNTARSEIPRFRSEHQKRRASSETSHILSQRRLSPRISPLAKKSSRAISRDATQFRRLRKNGALNQKVLAFLNSSRYKQD